ncbi:MAG: GNAT family N-acetyltransferase [Acidobacteriota bacterium]
MKLQFRPATEDDVPTIVAMLADDALGSRREPLADPLPAAYAQTFAAIAADPNHELTVAEAADAEGGRPTIVGTLQLSFLPYLTYGGGWRAQIEAVRVSSTARGGGVGAELMAWAIARARQRGCHLVQLTTDKQRPDALRFYEQQGFRSSHEGMKLHLEDRQLR